MRGVTPIRRWRASARARRIRGIVYTCCATLLLVSGDWTAPRPLTRATADAAELAPIDQLLVTKLSKPGDLTLKNSTLSEALFSVSETWKINMVVGEEVQGQVNGVFKDAPLHEILDAILLSNGYGYRPVGQSLVVMKLKDLGDVNPLFETAAIPVPHGKPEDIVVGVKLLSSPQGKIQVVPSARSLLVIDFPDRVALIRSYVKKLDDSAQIAGGDGVANGPADRMQVAHFAPQFVTALSLKEPLAAVLSKEGKVALMEGDNRLIVVDYPANLRLAQQSVKELDVPRQQVRITAFIYDLALEDEEALGINWKNVGKGRVNGAGEAQSAFTIDSLTQVPSPAGAVGGAITFMNLSRNFDLNAVIVAMSSCKNSRLLADPNVTVLNNEPALMSIVTEIPYQQLTQTSQGGNIGTTAFREAGVKLQVIPRIASDGTVRLECTPSFSRLAGYTPGDSPQPIIDRREAKTTVRVADRQTLVIGGLRTRNDIKEHTGIPFLKDLPLGIGCLFRSKEISEKESELVVFLTPEIITPVGPNKPREQLAQETAQCWLDNIPPGEGCPPNCAPRVEVLPGAPTPQPSDGPPGPPPLPPPVKSLNLSNSPPNAALSMGLEPLPPLDQITPADAPYPAAPPYGDAARMAKKPAAPAADAKSQNGAANSRSLFR